MQLFTPIAVGAMTLKHRVVMAPLTRSRSEEPGEVPGSLMLQYYLQRTSKGGLIISEATSISPNARGWFGAPGMFTEMQAKGWKAIVDGIHAKGGYFFSQLWHTGRSSHVDTTGGVMPVSASVNQAYWNDKSHLVSTSHGWMQPSPHRALEIGEIPGIAAEYRKAAALAESVGFDGVEIHAGNGYLLDQFLQNGSNQRTDAYGGSIPNRARLLFEVADAVTGIWGSKRVGVRIAPWGAWNGMSDSDPYGLFDYVAEELNKFDLAYLHIIEPRIAGNKLIEAKGPVASERLRKIFRGTVIAAGGFEPDSAETAVKSGVADLIAFGRHFLANPDLPRRIEFGFPLNPHHYETFYTFDARGYTDYPFYEDQARA